GYAYHEQENSISDCIVSLDLDISTLGYDLITPYFIFYTTFLDEVTTNIQASLPNTTNSSEPSKVSKSYREKSIQNFNMSSVLFYVLLLVALIVCLLGNAAVVEAGGRCSSTRECGYCTCLGGICACPDGK
ncbi:hypothetical protein TSAR_009216, partial [Trichomalopsis sarcophagae]